MRRKKDQKSQSIIKIHTILQKFFSNILEEDERVMIYFAKTIESTKETIKLLEGKKPIVLLNISTNTNTTGLNGLDLPLKKEIKIESIISYIKQTELISV